MTRSRAIAEALQRWVRDVATELDAAGELREITLQLKFSPGHLEPRALIDHISRERRKTTRPHEENRSSSSDR